MNNSDESKYVYYFKKYEFFKKVQSIRRIVIFAIALLIECIIGALFVGPVLNILGYSLICGAIAFISFYIDKYLEQYLFKRIKACLFLAKGEYTKMWYKREHIYPYE